MPDIQTSVFNDLSGEDRRMGGVELDTARCST
jgi:hypothetical protein